MRQISACVLLLSLVMGGGACTTAKFDSKKPIETETTFFGPRYVQGGLPLNRDELTDELYRSPASRDAMSGYKAAFYSGMALSGGGGFLIGWNLADSSPDKSSTPLYVGIGLAAVGITLGIVADGILRDGIESHNRSVQPKSSSILNWRPVACVTPDRSGAAQGWAGIQLGF